MSETLRGAIEDNVLTLLVWSDQHANELAERVTHELFSTRAYQHIANAALAYIMQFGEPPRSHSRDLLESELRRKDSDTLLAKTIEAMERLFPELNAQYVLEKLDKFIRVRQKTIAIEKALLELESGNEENAEATLWQSLNVDPAPAGLSDPWGEPIPPPFPVEVLPEPLRAFVQERAETTGIDPASIAWSALSACSAALDGSNRLQMKKYDPDFVVPPGLWVLLCGPPSTRKTPCLNMAWAPLWKIHHEDRAQWTSAKRAWDSQDKEARGDEPQQRRLITSDATMEAMQNILGSQHRGVAQLRDEFAGFIGQMDKYTHGRGSALDRAFYLKGWDGGPFTVDRQGRGFVDIENLHIVLCGGIQPDRLRTLGGDLTHDGLLQRFVPILVAKPRAGEDRPRAGRESAQYQMLIEHLTSVPGGRIVTLNAGARRIRVRIEQRALLFQDNNALGTGFSSFCGKLVSIWGRLVLTIGHIIDQNPSELGEQPAEIAEALVDNLLMHAGRFYEWLGGGGNFELTQQIAGYLLTKPITRLLPSTLTNNARACRGMTMAQLQQAVSPLVSMGWLTPEPAYNPKAWLINGMVYGKFANRAEEEKFKRNQIRQLILQDVAEQRPDAVPEHDKHDWAREAGRDMRLANRDKEDKNTEWGSPSRARNHVCHNPPMQQSAARQAVPRRRLSVPGNDGLDAVYPGHSLVVARTACTTCTATTLSTGVHARLN